MHLYEECPITGICNYVCWNSLLYFSNALKSMYIIYIYNKKCPMGQTEVSEALVHMYIFHWLIGWWVGFCWGGGWLVGLLPNQEDFTSSPLNCTQDNVEEGLFKMSCLLWHWASTFLGLFQRTLTFIPKCWVLCNNNYLFSSLVQTQPGFKPMTCHIQSNCILYWRLEFS